MNSITPTREQTRREIKTFLDLLRQMQKIDGEFPLQYAICLAEIAQEEGISLSVLSARTGLSLSTVSRIVGALSKYRQSGTPYGLVKVKISETERRRKELSLTARGRAIIESVADIVKKAA